MAHATPGQHQQHPQQHRTSHDAVAPATAVDVRRLAFSATVHCLTGCGIGEVLGLVIGTALGLGTPATIALAVVLAFVFGYLLTMVPLLRSGMPLATAAKLALAADTISISIMELVDNAVMLLIPGAMAAGLGSLLFWSSLALALAVAAGVAYPVNLYLLRRGRGHALVHRHHAGAEHSH